MELNRKNNISVVREAQSGKRNIRPDILFDSLRKSEYQAIVKQHYGEAPNVPNTAAYSIYKNLFVKIEPAVAHDLAVIHLKKRGDSVSLKEFISSVPDYFKSLSVSSKFSKTETEEIFQLLRTPLSIAG